MSTTRGTHGYRGGYHKEYHKRYYEGSRCTTRVTQTYHIGHTSVTTSGNIGVLQGLPQTVPQEYDKGITEVPWPRVAQQEYQEGVPRGFLP